MPTNNIGNPANETPVVEGKPARGILFLIGAGLLAVFALGLGFQVLGVFYSILVPPKPPIMDGLVEIGHTPTAHGVDSWRYVTDKTPKEVVDWYREESDGNCSGVNALENTFMADNATVNCVGYRHFSIFEMRWEASYIPGGNETMVRLFREVYWIGNAPDQPISPLMLEELD